MLFGMRWIGACGLEVGYYGTRSRSRPQAVLFLDLFQGITQAHGSPRKLTLESCMRAELIVVIATSVQRSLPTRLAATVGLQRVSNLNCRSRG